MGVYNQTGTTLTEEPMKNTCCQYKHTPRDPETLKMLKNRKKMQ